MPLCPFFIGVPGAALTSDLCEVNWTDFGTVLTLSDCFLLQEQNSALALENENQREQYERCLDEVSDPFPVR